MIKKWKVVSFIITTVMLFGGCGRYIEYNLKPDDELSEAVKSALGDAFDYHGKEEKDENWICYEYHVKRKDADTIAEFVEVINSSLGEEECKISVYGYEENAGGLEPVFKLNNYSDDALETADYDDFSFLYIRSSDINSNSVFFEPSLYAGIDGIKKLRLSEEMNQRAVAEGIDWYDYWPDLEEIIVDGEEAETE